MTAWFLFFLGLFTAWALYDEYAGWRAWLSILTLIATSAFGIKSCSESEWSMAHDRAKAEQAAADAKPRVIREVDGCKVYAFKAADRWHYFTRCPNKTTTESSWTENCGKNCTTTKTESIEATE